MKYFRPKIMDILQNGTHARVFGDANALRQGIKSKDC